MLTGRSEYGICSPGTVGIPTEIIYYCWVGGSRLVNSHQGTV